MPSLDHGRYRARRATSPQDREAALALRALCFRGGQPDRDPFDARCRHVVIEDSRDGRIVCTFRMLALASGREIGQSYSAQFYDLAALRDFDCPMIELGRFCIAPGSRNADVLRLAWGVLTQEVDTFGAGMLFGCSSFQGTGAREYADAFAMLRESHLAPPRWQPRVKAPEVVHFGNGAGRAHDPRRAMLSLPALLRSYLAMGGWVSGHAVVDRDLGTLHVFTGLEVAKVPAARQRALRAVAAAQPRLATGHALA